MIKLPELLDVGSVMIIFWLYYHALVWVISPVLGFDITFLLLVFASIGFFPLILICAWDGVFSRYIYEVIGVKQNSENMEQ